VLSYSQYIHSILCQEENQVLELVSLFYLLKSVNLLMSISVYGFFMPDAGVFSPGELESRGAFYSPQPDGSILLQYICQQLITA